jgi:hypothetical protein
MICVLNTYYVLQIRLPKVIILHHVFANPDPPPVVQTYQKEGDWKIVNVRRNGWF